MRKRLITIITLCVLAAGCGKDTWNYHGVKIPKRFDKHYTTSSGVRVQADVEVPPHALEAIDRGVLKQIERATAAHPTWSCANHASYYTASFVEPMGVTTTGSPAVIIDGRLVYGFVAGAGHDNFPYLTMVIPHYGPDWNHPDLESISRHESEHIRLWACSPYELFPYYTGANDLHPIFP